jgi:hypothetical protein
VGALGSEEGSTDPSEAVSIIATESDSAGHALEEIGDAAIQRDSQPGEHRRARAVRSPLIFLDLLEAYADCFSERRLTNASAFSPKSDCGPDRNVNVVGRPRTWGG